MEDSQILTIALVVGIPGIGAFALGFAINEVQADSDRDCENWPPFSLGPNDEPPENPHGCHEECIEGHYWYKIGEHEWCYWDDNATKES